MGRAIGVSNQGVWPGHPQVSASRWLSTLLLFIKHFMTLLAMNGENILPSAFKGETDTNWVKAVHF